MKKDPKLVYAQSSDIKARTYIEYRKDMKKKAIAELEIKEWIESKLQEKYRKKNIKVEKSGGDRFLWFLRGGGITREPDFEVYMGGEQIFSIEFQYADKEDLQFFDFKVSKVVRKVKNKIVPHKDRIFLYVLKNSSRYAFIEPKWIKENGELGAVDAWGSRLAFRVPREKFESILEEGDASLRNVIETMETKIGILEFQHQMISIWENDLSEELQKVIDDKKLFKIIPDTLEGFFKVCFALDHLHKIPKNVRVWLIYLLSFANRELNLKEIAMLTYAFDFLYSKIPPGELQKHELTEIENKVKLLLQRIDSFYKPEESLYISSICESPLEETRYALFSINMIEDIIQDAIFYHNADLKPITKIYQNVRDPLKISKRIREYQN